MKIRLGGERVKVRIYRIRDKALFWPADLNRGDVVITLRC